MSIIKFPKPKQPAPKDFASELLNEFVSVCYLRNESEKLERLEAVLINTVRFLDRQKRSAS